MTSEQQAGLVCDVMLHKKGEDIVRLDIRGLSILADYFLICSGNSTLQVQAISDAVDEALEKAGVKVRRREGYDQGRWIVLDTGDVMVHLFNREERDFYKLERLWINGDNIEYINPPAKAPAST
ncbi:MAG: ribosome silencing factor [Christensenellales bacterium]